MNLYFSFFEPLIRKMALSPCPSCAQPDIPTAAGDDGLPSDVGGFLGGQEEGHIGKLQRQGPSPTIPALAAE